MAANIIEPGSSLAGLASTVNLSQVPDKLHCSTCHNFLINAYRTTCCESCVCDKCYDQLDDHCPICKHKPFSKDLVRPNKAMRGTAKAYLKNIEKSQAEERAKSQTVESTPDLPVIDKGSYDLENGDDGVQNHSDSQGQTVQHNGVSDEETSVATVQPSIETDTPATELITNPIISPPKEEDVEQRAMSHSSDEMEDDDDDEIEIQVEPAEGEEYPMHPPVAEAFEEGASFANTKEDNFEHSNDQKEGMNGMDSSFHASNMGMGFNMNLQPMHMMQQMQQMMMGNPMMGAMGMNPNMFGGFQNGGLNGMDMSMMNFTNQNMFGWNGQSNNNFDNAYSNGMNGSFGPSFGFDMSQQGNFQQQFQNGDFQSGYSDYRGRGRGRFRGGRGSFRGRGHFNQFSQNNFQGIQNVFDQPQQNGMPTPQHQAQNPPVGPRAGPESTNTKKLEQDHNPQDFAPGGQAEVQEALGDQHRGQNDSSHDDDDGAVNISTPQADTDELNDQSGADFVSMNKVTPVDTEPASTTTEKPIPEAYHEDFDSMAPPSAPVGPSGRHGDRDFGFRSRGRGRYGHYARGSFSQRDMHPISPIKTASPTSTNIPSPKTQGLGVQGAPTGPRAMRDPAPPKNDPVTNGGGLQIKGQAALQSQSQVRKRERTRSPSIVNGYDSSDDKRSRKQSRHERFSNQHHREQRNIDHDYSDNDRKRKRSHRLDDQDHEMLDSDLVFSRASPPERRSHRSSRHDKDRDRERDNSRAKHRNTRNGYDGDGVDVYDSYENGMEVDSSPSGHRSTGRNGKSSSKRDDWERDRDRGSHRDRDNPREKNNDKYRERDRDTDRDRDERHRKRSRAERDRDDDLENDQESRHRSRRQKKEHHSSSRRDKDRDRDRLEQDDTGYLVSSRSSTHRNQAASALPTPTSTKSETFESEKDPHTLEREARNRERLLKEQQRREKAAADKKGPTASKFSRGTVSGGRKVSYKYEDEIERSMDESDRRWR